MNQTSSTQQQGSKPLRASVLREERLQQLMESCQQEVLKQIIGPFGLTSAMFDDKDGGNVTTLHNFEQGVTATQSDQERYEAYQHNLNAPINRDAYDADLPAKRKVLLQGENPIPSAYTGNELPRDGRMHLDHVRSAKSMETNSSTNLFMTKDERVATANAPENLVPAESNINQSMQDKDKLDWANSQRKKDPGKTNAESFGVDMNRLEETKNRADSFVDKEIFKAQVQKQGKEVLSTGATEAGKNALRQAFGVLLHEFTNGSFVEIKVLLKDKHDEQNLIDRLIESLKRVMQRVIGKLKAALEALLQGGVQGFISNFLTFLINNLITTAKKFVTVIREGMQGLWQAIKLMLNPPKDMPAMEIARQVTKIIAGVVTTGLGMLMEESVKGFIASLPILVPIADILSAAITAIITGVVGALVVYGLDRIFDWLSSTGTELLQAYEANMEAQADVVVHMQQWLEQQFQNSRQYEVCAAEYQRVHKSYSIASFRLETATLDAGASINSHSSMIETVAIQLDRKKRLSDVLRSI